MIYKKLALTGLVCAMLSGCMVGPNYKRPELDLPPLSEQTPPRTYHLDNWWEMFGDTQLTALQARALQYNKDLQQAMERVEQARAAVTEAVSNQLPGIGLQGSSGRNGSYYGSVQSSSTATTMASFELDLWGKYRRLSEAARAELLATKAAQDTVRLALTAEVANTYFTLHMLDAQLAIAQRTWQSRQENVRIYTKRYQVGVIAEVDLRRVEADMYSVETSMKNVQLQLQQAETALAVLVGESPREMMQPRAPRDRLPGDKPLPQVPAGLPSEFLAYRPDVCSAEGKLIAANAYIGAARAAYFPSISLTGAAGFASEQLQRLFVHGLNGVWNIGAGVAQPVFAGGQIIAQNRAAQAKYREMLAAYEKTVQTAFKEALDALQANQMNREIVQVYENQTQALQRSYELTKKQEDAGLIGTTEVLDVERNLLQAEMGLEEAKKTARVGVVELAKALGGGW